MRKRSKGPVRSQGDGFRKHVTVTVGPVVGDGQDRYCRVEPSVARVQYGGTVTFRCVEGCGPLELFVPTPKRASDAFPRSGRLLAVPGKRRGKKFTVTVAKAKNSKEVEYPYAVYCRGCNCFGRGSMPKMIIGPSGPASS